MKRLLGKHLVLIVCALAAAPASASRAPWSRPSPDVKPDTTLVVDVGWLKERLRRGPVQVLDARPLERYEAGHIAGARWIDARAAADPERAAEWLANAGIPAGGTFVCYADSTDPAAAGRLFWLLEVANESDAHVLAGGFEAWRAAQGEVRRGRDRAAAALRRRPKAAADTSRIAGRELVRTVIGRLDWVLVDWRPKPDWELQHVPHSLPFDFAAACREVPDLDARKFKARFEMLGPRAGETVNMTESFVVFGDVPIGSPIHPYLAARLAGLQRVRCYEGGWSDWSARGDAPVMRLVDAAAVARIVGPRAAEDATPCPEAILLDLRGEQEYLLGHLPGSIHVPMFQFERDIPAVLDRHWPHADRALIPVVLYCYGPDCTRSRRAASALSHLGYRNLLWFRGSIWEWKAAGFPLVERR